MRNRKSKRNLKSKTSRTVTWNQDSDKSKSALERFLFSLICFQWFCNKSKPRNENDDQIYDASRHPRQMGDRIPTRRGGHRPSFIYDRPPSAFDDSPRSGDVIMLSSRTEALNAFETDQHNFPAEDPAIVFTPLPGAIMDDEYQYPPPDLFILPGFPVRQSSMLRHGQLPPLRYAVGAPSPLSSTFLNAATNGHPVHAPEPLTSRPVSTLDTGESRLLDGSMDDLELDLDEVIIMPSRKVAWIEATNPESDKKQKKKRKKDSRTKYQVAGKLGKKKEPKDTSIAKIPSVKEWAKQEEKKRKAEEKRQKKELEKDKKKQKEMEKRIAKANKLKKDQQKKEDREIKKARKATAKAEKAAAKAKKVTDKADAKRMKKRSKLEVRLNKQLKDSDEQMAAYLEKQKELVKERKKRREDKSREMLNEIAKAEETIKSLQEKVERKERKVAQLGERRSKSGDTSILVAFTLNYKIKEYQQRIYSIKSVITKLKEKIEAKKKEVEQLAPHLLEMGESTETQNFGASESICGNSEVADDDKSILDMLCGLDSDSECSDDEVEELAAPKEICVQDALQKAQESLQKMDEVGLSGSCSLAGDKEPSCTYEGKGKGPANGKETVKKCLSIVNQLTMTI